MKREVEIYDTTLRDGTQAEDFNLSLEDKIRASKKLDELGVHYIEGGWPGSNPKDIAFFREIKNYELKHAKIAAFGSTCNPRSNPEQDKLVEKLVEAGTEVITIFGKSWTVHVRDALKTTEERNLEIIRDTVAYLKKHCKTLFYDAEHFFDGFKADSQYALETLRAALDGGADCLILCDTNGGTLTSELRSIIQRVQAEFPKAKLGIHTHNDSELAVANSLAAVELGASHVQGTMNGVGERCGNANLSSIIPALKLKMGINCISDKQLKQLREASRYILELANMRPYKYQPYVGRSAFAHKGGVHVAAVERNPACYEHLLPELVGNIRRFPVSDLSGGSTVAIKARQYGIDLASKDPVARQVLDELKQREHEGYQYEAAEGSLELMLQQATGKMKRHFEFAGFKVLVSKDHEDEPAYSEATVMLKVGGQEEHTAAAGIGPVHALDQALRKALERFYPELSTMRLNDYKVRVLSDTNGDDSGTAAKVRVLIESVDQDSVWGTVGVSENILEASWLALVDSIVHKLQKENGRKEK